MPDSPDTPPAELHLVEPGPSAAASKILTIEQLIERRREARRRGLRVVHCHGCFDIVHPGHVRHLRHARTNGDILLVSITSDSGVNKGAGRPLIPEELRAENLAALDFVDWVHIDDSATARDLLDRVQPDVYVKGREYELNEDPRFRAERDAVEAHGGRVVFTSGDVVFSSTALIAAMEHSADPYHARLSQLLKQPQLAATTLTGHISRFRQMRAVVIGETIVDIYVLCDRPEITGESPVMTLRPIETRRYDGGAAVVARHLAAMGARPILITGMPPGETSDRLRQSLVADGVEVRSVPTDSALAEKQRYLVGGQKVMKVDLLEPCRMDAAHQDELVHLAAEAAEGCDAAVIADFGQGLLSARVLAALCPTLRDRARVTAGIVSGRRANLRQMRQMDLLAPSERQLRDATGMHDESLPAVAWRLLQDAAARAALVTLGADGLIAFDRLPDAEDPGEPWRSRVKGEHVPALSPHTVDSLGCPDALLAAATLTLAAGGSLLAGAFVGSIAAAAQAQRLGNTVVGATDLRQGVARIHASHLTYAAPDLITPRAALTRKVRAS